MRIPKEAIEGVLKLASQIVNNYTPYNQYGSGYNRYNITLEYCNYSSHFVIIAVYRNDSIKYLFAGVLDNISLNSRITVTDSPDTIPYSSIKFHIGNNNKISIDSKVMDLNKFYIIDLDSRIVHTINNSEQTRNGYYNLSTLDIGNDISGINVVSDKNKIATQICNGFINELKQAGNDIIGYCININSMIGDINFVVSTETDDGIKPIAFRFSL